MYLWLLNVNNEAYLHQLYMNIGPYIFGISSEKKVNGAKIKEIASQMFEIPSFAISLTEYISEEYVINGVVRVKLFDKRNGALCMDVPITDLYIRYYKE